MAFEKRVLVKGGGDLGTGVILALYRAGYRVVVTELPNPLVVRRTVSMASAVSSGTIEVEGVTSRLVTGLEGIQAAWEHGEVPVVVDPDAGILRDIRPDVLVDAILAKHNTGTRTEDAPLVIALGPGFYAGVDCHAIVETQRGPNLGRVILDGPSAPDSGIPGEINGETVRRILRAPADGVFTGQLQIGAHVVEGDVVARIGDQPVVTQLTGVIRGLVADGLEVQRGLKVGDVDPRDDVRLCFKVSDKAHRIGEGVMEAITKLTPPAG